MGTLPREKWFWATQALTAARVALAFLFVILSPFAELWLLVASIYAVAWITDVLDGRLARSKHVTSRFGGAMDVFGDRYLTVVSLLYVGFRGVSFVIIAVILIRELYSVAMRMVQIDGRGVMMSNTTIGGIVHIVIGFGTLNLVCRPEAVVTLYSQMPFLLVMSFYLFYFPWSVVKSWSLIMSSIRSDLEKNERPAPED